ncbi:hypothetical protein V2J09_002241 [Rumex salicifolius]
MDDQLWSYGRLTSSKYNHAANKSASYDFYDDYEEVDVDEDLEAEYICPFCSEEFDILGLCCHIEEAHPVESKKGICPICGVLVGVNLIDHVAMEHEYVNRISFLQMCPSKYISLDSLTRNYRGDHDERDFNTISILQKEMDDRSLESLLMRPPSGGYSLNVAADRLLTSFIGNYSSTADVRSMPSSSEDICHEEKPSSENILERAMENLSVKDENKEEKARRCKFVHSLLFSTILDDGL